MSIEGLSVNMLIIGAHNMLEGSGLALLFKSLNVVGARII